MTTIPLAELSLFVATPAQILESRKRSADSWAFRLTHEQYVLRDVVMDGDEHARNGRLVIWVLAPRSNPQTLDFMCSVETFRRSAVVAKRSKDGQPPEIINVTGYGVASVFTPASKRRRGYGQHMMRLLHWVLAPRAALPYTFPAAWGEPPVVPPGAGNGQFSVLYSDVGPEFYRACGPTQEPVDGWLVSGAFRTCPTSVQLADVGGEPNGRWVWLAEESIQATMPAEAERIKGDLARISGNVDGRTLFSFLPHEGVAAFVIRRTMTIDSPTNTAITLPTDTWGVALVPEGVATVADALDSHISDPTFAIWTLDVGSTDTLTIVVLRLRATPSTFPSLLRMLVHAAHKVNANGIEVWGLQEEWRSLAHNQGWVTEDRPDHLSAFKWYGTEKGSELEWMFNEKFCWC